MKITSTLLALVLAAAGTVAACGGSQPEAESAPPAPAPTPAPAPAPAPSEAAPAPAASEAPPAATAPPEAPAAKAWPDLSGDERKELMKTVVLPAMKTAFQEFDAKRFAEVRCTTCHGAGAMQGKFTMPNPALPKLDPKDGFAKHMKKDPKTTKFMMEHVAPDMGKILGIPPFDPKTNQGFGCFNCHTMAGK